MPTTLRARQMKIDAIEAKVEMLTRSLAALHLKTLALQAMTAELALRGEVSPRDIDALAEDLADRHPPEVIAAIRAEIARLMRA